MGAAAALPFSGEHTYRGCGRLVFSCPKQQNSFQGEGIHTFSSQPVPRPLSWAQNLKMYFINVRSVFFTETYLCSNNINNERTSRSTNYVRGGRKNSSHWWMREGKYAATASKFYGVPINMMHNSNKVRHVIWKGHVQQYKVVSHVPGLTTLLLQWVIITTGHFSTPKIFQDKKTITGTLQMQ